MSTERILERLTQEEAQLQFDRFSRADALKLGMKIYELAQEYPNPVAVEITINRLVVFRFFPDGALPDSGLWLTRKRNTVDLMQMSSLHFMYWLEAAGETLDDRKLDPAQYAVGGGGFPLSLKGTGVVGSVCVSGLSHEQDHQLIVDAMTAIIAGR